MAIMDYTFITTAVQSEWNLWNIRGFMILSLSTQLVLAVLAPMRQKTSNRFVISFVWSAYLLADWAALYVFGLISNAGCRHSENKDKQVPMDVMALWAGFLLVHLGGPDTITAFSLEDNALWLRHLIGLVAQLFAFLYIFVKTLPNNRLLVPTVLIFVAGVINYGERTRALYLASSENLKRTIKKTEEGSSRDFLQHIFMGLTVDIVPDLKKCNESKELIFFSSPDYLLNRIAYARGLLYEHFYTKIKAANSTRGKIARAITTYSTVVAFIVFCLADKNRFHGVDHAITCALFVGAFILQVANVMMFITSDFLAFTTKNIILLAFGQGIYPLLLVIAFRYVTVVLPEGSAMERLITRGWSEKMGSSNMLFHCFKQCAPRKCKKLGFIWNVLAGERYVSMVDFDISLWNSVFQDIKGKAADTSVTMRMRELYEARGDRTVEESNCRELMPYIRDFQYDNTLLIWHIATEICLNIEGEEDNVVDADMKMKRIFSKKLSDYMIYLLVRQQKLMSAVAGISHIRYEDTCIELKRLGRKFGAPTMREFCTSILSEYNKITESSIEEQNHVYSVLKDSCRLVQLLRENNNLWEVIYKVWVELLSYAAGHCRVDSHVRLLSEGSEFITLIWMLMSLCGIGDQFPLN